MDKRERNDFGAGESEVAETENSCHRFRIKGNRDVGRFQRVNFLRESTALRRPLMQGQLASQPQSQSGEYLFYREGQSLALEVGGIMRTSSYLIWSVRERGELHRVEEQFVVESVVSQAELID